MKTLPAFLASITTCLFLHASSAQAAVLESIFPADTEIYLELGDLPRSRARWNDGAMAARWQSDAMRPIREYFSEEMFRDQGDDPTSRKMMEEMTKMLGMIEGGVALGLFKIPDQIKAAGEAAAASEGEDTFDPDADEPIDFSDADWDEDDGPKTPMVMEFGMVANIGPNVPAFKESVVRMMELKKESEKAEEDADKNAKKRKGEKEYEGVTVYYSVDVHEDGKEVGGFLALVSNHVVVSNNEQRLQSLISAILKGGAPGSLAGRQDIARARGRVAGPDMTMFINLPHLMGELNTWMKGQKDPIPMAGFSIERLSQVLELDAMSAMSMSAQIEKDGLMIDFEAGFERETGLSKLLVGTHKNAELKRPGFIPLMAQSVSSTNMDLPAWFQDFKALVETISPQVSGMIGLGMMTIKTSMGVDLEQDIIGPIGTRIYTAEYTNAQLLEEIAKRGEDIDEEALEQKIEDGTARLFALELRDKAKFQRSLATMLSNIGPGLDDALDEEDYLGQAVYSLPGADAAGPGLGVSFTYLNDTIVMVIGEISFLQAAIRAHQKIDKSIWEGPLAEVLNTMPREGIAVQVADLKSLSSAFMAGAMIGFGSALPFDVEPLTDMLGQVVMHSTRDGTRLVSRTKIYYGKD